MDAELKSRWIEALKSGTYPKTRGVLWRDKPNLVDPEGYCCLGVLCSISGAGEFMQRKGDIPLFLDAESGETADAALPRQMRERMGIPTSIENLLMTANDTADTFAPVIELIEAKL